MLCCHILGPKKKKPQKQKAPKKQKKKTKTDAMNYRVSSYATDDDDDNDDDIIIIIINIIIIVSFMQGIYTHISETNHVPREYTVAAILSLLFIMPLSLVPVLALLYFYVSTFLSMCAAPNMAVFCSSLTSWFPGMSLTCFLNDL